MATRYYVFIHKPGPNWLADKPIDEQPLEKHFHYMSRLQKAGKLVLGGGFLDNSGALGVLLVEDLDHAHRIVDDDPAVQEEIVTTEVHPWLVTVSGCVGID